MASYRVGITVRVPDEEIYTEPDVLRALGYSEREIEDHYRRLQQMQHEQIARNRRLMKAGLIKFDQYEEVT